MTAWAVIRAMERHEPFASYVSKGSLERDPECFDLGVAVALPGDKLETAVIQKANTLEWNAFPDRFNQVLREARKESTASKNRVSLSISSMGACGCVQRFRWWFHLPSLRCLSERPGRCRIPAVRMGLTWRLFFPCADV